MKKAILILGVIFLIVSCQEKKQKNMSDTVCEGYFSAQMFNIITQQLHLKCEDCYVEFVSEQILPGSEEFSIWVIPKIAFMETDEYSGKSFSLDSYILLVNNQTGKIVNKYYEPGAWSSDAYQLITISIDTPRYRLGDKIWAFGIRDSYKASSSVNPSSSNYVSLFIPQGDSLKKVFGYSSLEFQGEFGINGEGQSHSTNGGIILSENETNGFFDIILKNETANTIYDLVENDIQEDVTTEEDFKFFRYTNTGYKETKANIGFLCEKSDNDMYEECFYFDRTLEQVYHITREKESYLEQYLRPVLPTEDTEYNIEEDEEDIIRLTYR